MIWQLADGTIFLYLDDALVLANSYTQAKEDGQRVVQLLQKLGFVLSLEKCQLESNQEFTLGSGVWQTEYNLVTSPGQGPGNKGPGSQSILLCHMQRHNEATGLDKFCQYGTTSGKITLLPPTILAQGELQDTSQSVQRAEVKSRSCSDPALVGHFQSTTKVSIQTPNRGSGDNRCLQGGLWGPHEQPVLLGQVATKKGKNTHINILELETEWMACQRFQESLKGRLSPSR